MAKKIQTLISCDLDRAYTKQTRFFNDDSVRLHLIMIGGRCGLEVCCQNLWTFWQNIIVVLVFMLDLYIVLNGG